MLTPDILFDSYRDITPAFLQSQGVTLLLTDLDYTLVAVSPLTPGSVAVTSSSMKLGASTLNTLPL
jgi:predicted HAD superfamily phosphohydrolase YqeG